MELIYFHVFTQGMFKRPNIKGMQTVFYSLIWILSPDYCKKFIPWPVGFSSDNYKFRAAIINFITKVLSLLVR